MTTFTLIAYRPNHNSWDEYNDSSNSDLQINISESLDEIVKHIVNYEFSTECRKYNYRYDDWELTLLIDGKEEYWDEEDETNIQHMALREICNDKVAEGIAATKQQIIENKRKAEEQRIINEQRRAEEQRLLQIQIQEENKRKEYELFLKLKEKYKDVNS
jgi:hypothetical protein